MAIIPSPYQYPHKLSHCDDYVYRAFEECRFPNAVNIIEEFGGMLFLMGKHIPSARPCCVNGFAVETIRALRCTDDFGTFTDKMREAFRNVPDNVAYYGPLYWSDPDGDDAKNLAAKDECWKQTRSFLKAVWDQDQSRRAAFGQV